MTSNAHKCGNEVTFFLNGCLPRFLTSLLLGLFLLKCTLTEILPMLHFKLDPLQSTEVIGCNHHIKNWPAVNWPIVEPLAVNILSAERRRRSVTGFTLLIDFIFLQVFCAFKQFLLVLSLQM